MSRVELEQRLNMAKTIVLSPPPTMTLSEWSATYMVLSPEASAEPGRFKFIRAEFQRGVMDALSDPRYKKVVIEAASQILKTQSILNFIGYIMHLDPGPILIVQPTGSMADSFSKDRVSTMLRDVPVLHGLVRDSRERDSGNTTLHKLFPAGHLTMVGSNSPSNLAARPIRYLLLDEVDRYTVTSEGDPVDIATKRTTSFFNKKIILVSSPGDEDISRIHSEYESSDRRLFHVPCHRCGAEAPLTWDNVKWETGKPDTAKYECPHCQSQWTNYEKNHNVKSGHWVARDPGNKVAGFNLNAIYSAFTNLEELVEEFLAAKKSPEQLKVFINTRLAQVWSNSSKTVSDIQFLNRLEDYHEDAIPNDIVLITAGLDTQDNRIEMEIVGWGKNDESWSLDYQVFYGSPSTPIPWDSIKDYIGKLYTRRDGIKLRVAAFAQDSGGHYTQDVYSFAAKQKKVAYYAIKGVPGPKPIFNNRASKSKKHTNAKFHLVGSDTGKEKLYNQLAIEDPGPGYCHFPYDRDDPAYFEQLTSERYQIKYKFGRPTKVWVLPPNARNEALDCRVYAMAARYSINIDFEKRAESLQIKAERLAGKKPEVVEVAEPEQSSNPEDVVMDKLLSTRRQRVRPARSTGGWLRGIE